MRFAQVGTSEVVSSFNSRVQQLNTEIWTPVCLSFQEGYLLKLMPIATWVLGQPKIENHLQSSRKKNTTMTQISISVIIQLVVSTHLKNISQIGSFPLVGM